MSPPPDLLRKKALYAAASVVMAFGLGCTEKDDEDDGTTDSGDTTDIGDDGGGDGVGTGGDGSGTGGDDGSGTGGDDGAGTGGDDGAGTGGDDGAGTGDGGGTGGDDGADTAPDCTQATDMATCCEELAEWCDDAHGADSDAAIECLYGPDFDGSTGCIPWGPPVPPAMS